MYDMFSIELHNLWLHSKGTSTAEKVTAAVLVALEDFFECANLKFSSIAID